MKIQRFFFGFDIGIQNVVISDADFYNQIKNVLRLKSGDKIILCDGKSNEAECVINSIENKKVNLEIINVHQNKNEPKIKLSVYCSVLKRENFELVCQKLTELGVYKIIPLICENTVKQGIKIERLRSIVKEAAEQSQRGVIPQLFLPQKLSDAIEIAQKDGPIFIFDRSGTAEKIHLEDGDISIFIGPEGGWDKSEIDLFKKNKAEIFSLGKLNFRAETAAITGAFATIYGNDF